MEAIPEPHDSENLTTFFTDYMDEHGNYIYKEQIEALITRGRRSLTINFDDVVNLSPLALLWFGLVGIINYVMGRQFSYLAIKHIGVTKATPLIASEPLFAMTIAVSFLGESTNPIIVIGTLTIVLGLYLVVTSQ